MASQVGYFCIGYGGLYICKINYNNVLYKQKNNFLDVIALYFCTYILCIK